MIFAFLLAFPMKASADSENPVDRMTFFGDSTTAHLALGDAIATALMYKRNFHLEDFRRLHPDGITVNHK